MVTAVTSEPPASTRPCRRDQAAAGSLDAAAALDAEVLAGWLTADEIYGQDRTGQDKLLRV